MYPIYLEKCEWQKRLFGSLRSPFSKMYPIHSCNGCAAPSKTCNSGTVWNCSMWFSPIGRAHPYNLSWVLQYFQQRTPKNPNIGCQTGCTWDLAIQIWWHQLSTGTPNSEVHEQLKWPPLTGSARLYNNLCISKYASWPWNSNGYPHTLEVEEHNESQCGYWTLRLVKNR